MGFETCWIDSMFSMPTVIFTIGGVVGIVGIVGGCVTSIVVNRAREKTKREIAAYVAEGSIDPDKAVEMFKAASPKDD
jgi:outer membrane murein-binding lipoprotein Lpp